MRNEDILVLSPTVTVLTRGAGSKLKVGKGSRILALSAGKIFYYATPLFCSAPLEGALRTQ